MSSGINNFADTSSVFANNLELAADRSLGTVRTKVLADFYSSKSVFVKQGQRATKNQDRMKTCFER